MLANLLAAQLYSAPVNFVTGVPVTFDIGDVNDAPAVRDLRPAPRRVKLTSSQLGGQNCKLLSEKNTFTSNIDVNRTNVTLKTVDQQFFDCLRTSWEGRS